MEGVDRVHPHPFGAQAQLGEAFAGNGGGVAEQRIKMGRGVETITGAAEGAAITTHHVVLLDQQDGGAQSGQLHGGKKPADARADHYHVVRGGGFPVAQAAKGAFQVEASGRLRPYISWAATNSPLAIAAPIESSPASKVAATISASLRALP